MPVDDCVGETEFEMIEALLMPVVD